MRGPLLALLIAVGCGRPTACRPAGPPPVRTPRPDPGLSATTSLAGPDAPNVLLVSLDTVRADHIGAWGYARDTMPTLDAVAAEGARFARSWAQAPLTDGTHGSLFSGRTVIHHAKLKQGLRLPDDEWTLAEHFAHHGYRTFGLATSIKFVPDANFGQGFATWELFPDGPKARRSPKVLARLPALTADESAPFFGFVHLFDAHAPYSPPEPHRSLFLDGKPAIAPAKTIDFIQKNRRNKKVPDRKRQTLIDLYDGSLHYLDTHVARLMELARGTRRPTIVVFFSDHGEAFGEHGYYGHDNVMWEEVLRVPVVIWAPGRVPAGAVVTVPTQTVDLYPTLVSLAGLPLPTGLDGFDFGPALRGTPGAPLPGERILVLQDDNTWALVTERAAGLYKLIARLKPRRLRLHHLGDDPRERRDATPRAPALAAELKAAFQALGPNRPFRNGEKRAPLSAEETEELRALGYMD